MLEFRHILFPIDFSQRSKDFRDLVQFVASQFRSRLTLLNVVPLLVGAEYGDLTGIFPSMEDYTAVEQRMNELLAEFFPKQIEEVPEIHREVSLGDPAVVIGDYAANHGVDLIMMPTHGYGRFRSLLMGSVVSKVLHDAECPVWTAAHGDGSSAVSHTRLKNILAAIGSEEEQTGVLAAAADLAREFDAAVQLIHAVPAAEHVTGDTGGDEFGHFLLHKAHEQIERLQTQAGTKFEVHVEAGAVAKSIRQAAVGMNADLVILGRGVAHAAFGRVRSETYDIIRESPCPVLSL